MSSIRSRHPLVHQPHLNGNSAVPTTPGGLSNGGPSMVSPSVVATAVPNGVTAPASSIVHKLAVANEQTWLLIGRVAEQMGDLEHALSAYENALRHNPMSLSGLTQVAGIARIKENYPKAVDYFQRVLGLQEENGEVWSALGHCYLMQDDLQKAYSAYQQALYLLPNPKEDPKLWYGIGILYDRYGSLDHAEEAFSSVLRMDKDFDKANEILFRLGIIYKQQGKYDESLTCFDRILRNPPSPLAHADIWFQIGHVYEQQNDNVRAKDAYERVVVDNPTHAKVLQQLGWLYHQDGTTFQNQDLAIQHLTKSLEADSSDAQSWYLLGRAYMAGQKYNKAYEAYQQAVYRDGRNPTFWCSIGVLYFQINQFRDALDAYSRAIRINPYISEVWFDLGSLYESCNNQISDAIDAYARASELDPSNVTISQRLELLKTAQATGGQLPAAPGPQDVHPTAYATAAIPPPGFSGPPLTLHSAGPRPDFRAGSRGPAQEVSLPPVAPIRRSPGPWRGGPPPPVVLDESRHNSSHTPLAPMEVDRTTAQPREYVGPVRGEREREGPPSRGPVGHESLLLHHPVPQQDIRNGIHGPPPPHQESYFTRAPRATSPSVSPPVHHNGRARSPPPPPFSSYPPGRMNDSNAPPSQRSPRVYQSREQGRPVPVDQEGVWSRRPNPDEHRDVWMHERRSRHNSEYPLPQQQQQQLQHAFFPSNSPGPGAHRGRSPVEQSPRSAHPPRGYWDKNSGGPPATHPSHRPSPPPATHEPIGRRYDPRYDARDQREYEHETVIDQRMDQRSYVNSPEATRNPINRNPPSHITASIARESESPPSLPGNPEPKERRRRAPKDKEPEAPNVIVSQEAPPKKERKKRTNKRVKDDQSRTETPKPFAADRNLSANYKGAHGYQGPSPEPVSSNSSSNRSPTNTATPRPPSRVVDEDYDEGVADALMDLAAYRAPEMAAPSAEPPSHSPTISIGSRHSDPSPRPPPSHRGSVSSTRSHASPPSQPITLKRPLSPGPDEVSDTKRSRMDISKRRMSSPSGSRRTPLPSTRPSPIPFRTQPASHSPEARQPLDPYPTTSPTLPAVLPPHPRPIGAGLSHGSGSGSVALPPITTLSPASTAPSPASLADRDRDDRMHVDPRPAPEVAPRRQSRTPPKHTPSPQEKSDAAP